MTDVTSRWPSTLTLECWIVGETLTERSLVQVDRNKWVKDLRQAIREERDDALGDVKAVNIMLWKVSILTKSDYWNEEIIYEIMSKTDPLVPTDRLNKVYPTKPEQDHVHVIAWTRKVNLNCWIVGEYTRRIFPVTISNDQNVADLQGVIKEKRLSAMPKIDELDLMLWKVSIAAKEDNRDKNIQQFLEGRNKPEPFIPTERLSNIYPTPPRQDHLHFIVSYPRILNLQCWIVGDYATHIFTATINNNQNVADLQRVIQEEKPFLMSRNIDDLMLWKVSIPAKGSERDKDIQHFLEGTYKPEPFLPTERLSNIYPTPPRQDHLHIIISYPRILNLVCWVLKSHNNSKDQTFTISVNGTQLVSDLRRLLKEKSLVPKYIEAYDLSLWRVSIPYKHQNIERCAKEITDKEDELREGPKLSDIFSTPLDSRSINIVIRYPEKEQLPSL